MHGIIAYLQRWKKWQIFLFAIVLDILFGLLDYLTGPDLSLFILYLIPVFLGTWFIGTGTGLLLSSLGALAWSLADRIYGSLIIPYWNLAVEVGTFFIITYIIAALKQTLETEKQLARIDHLTGAVNRRHFIELAEAEIHRTQRYEHPFSVAFLDVDDFKMINDSGGHHAGDDLLKTVVRTIRNDTRSSDVIARLGGDEFIVLFPETGFATAQAVVEKIKVRLGDAMAAHHWPVTFSLGVMTFHEPPASVDQMIKLVDGLMYEVKKNGKNSVRCKVYST